MFNEETDEYPSDILSTQKEIDEHYKKYRIIRTILMPVNTILCFIERIYRIFFPIESFDDML